MCSTGLGGSLAVPFGLVAPHSRQTTAAVGVSSLRVAAIVRASESQKGKVVSSDG